MSAFSDKVVWITGASSGIGEALAIGFAAKGAIVILSSRKEDELKKVQARLGTAPERSMVLTLDLAQPESLAAKAEAVIARFGRIDILVNNGGLSQRATAAETSLEIDRRIMEVNYFGTVALTKAVLPHMLQRKSGHIVVISSIAGKFGFYLRSSYSASKHALHGFFESLRMEIHKSFVNVLIVCPGKVKTNISLNALDGKGGTHSKMDAATEQGVSAAECAEKIMKAIEKNKEELYVGGKELRAVWVKRMFPNLFSKLIRRQKPE